MTTYWLLTAAVSFGVFAAVAAIASIAVSLATPAIARRCEGSCPAASAAGLFRLRMLPGALAIAIAFALVLPAFLGNEPRDTTEQVPRVLALLAFTGLAGLATALWLAAYRLPLRTSRARQRFRLAVSSRTGRPRSPRARSTSSRALASG